MKIVIDIPREEYKNIKSSTAPMIWAEHLIKNGTPLNEVLDKIKIEIASYGTNSGMLLALEILDKYKIGSEVRE